jgi:phosphoribosylformylglycinamidine synthase PurS subunit
MIGAGDLRPSAIQHRTGAFMWKHGHMIFSVHVEVRLRPGIADPQGSTIERAMPTLGFSGVSGVRVGKSIRFEIDAADEASARAEAEDLCRRFLTNPVIEDAIVELEPVGVPS